VGRGHGSLPATPGRHVYAGVLAPRQATLVLKVGQTERQVSATSQMPPPNSATHNESTHSAQYPLYSTKITEQ